MTDDPTLEITEITSEIDSLLNNRSDVYDNLKTINQERKDLRTKIAEMSPLILHDRKSLDKLYSQQNEYRSTQKTIFPELKHIKATLRDMDQQFRNSNTHNSKSNSRNNYSGISSKKLAEKLEKLEWKLQTESLSRTEEKNIIDNIKHLGQLLKTQSTIDSSKTERHKLVSRLQELQGNLNKNFTDYDVLNKELSKIKQSLQEKLSTRDSLFTNLNEMRVNIENLLKNLDETNDNISKLKTKRRQIIQTKKSHENSIVMDKMKSILEDEKEKAKKKLSDGKTLSLDELRLALDQDDEYLKL